MDQEIRVFATSPRTPDFGCCWSGMRKVATLADKLGFTGILIFTGNDTHLDPWIVAQHILHQTNTLSPLIAVNPIYMHPFTAARMTASLTLLFSRKMYLNMITGTALSSQKGLGDVISHDERYVRLEEYIGFVRRLLETTRPLRFDGKYYQANDLQLMTGISAEYTPEFLLPGHSDAARRVCIATKSTSLRMLEPRLEEDLSSDARGIHFGIMTRQSEEAAWEAARARFSINPESQSILEFSMQNTDSVWKQRLKLASEQATNAGNGYWLVPFSNYQADCPYLVGAYEYVSEKLQRLIAAGITTFVFDFPGTEEDVLEAEFKHVSQVLRLSEIIQQRN